MIDKAFFWMWTFVLTGTCRLIAEEVQHPVVDFQGPESCAKCHPRHYQEWRGSAHAYATFDPLFRACNRRALKETGGEIGAFCVNCHAPLGTRTGELSSSFDVKDVSPLVGAGVSCEVCHKLEALKEGKPIANGNFDLSAGNVFFGRLFNPASTFQHESSSSDLIGQSAFCGSCHDVMRGSALLEKTFAQWSASVYRKERIDHCQDCHMIRYSGQAAEGGPFRETLRRHNFPAVSIPLVPFPNRGYQLEQVKQFIRTAARMAVTVPECARAGGEMPVRVSVKNSGAGHNLPTGLSNERQMWIELTLLDEEGRALFRSGALDENGDLMDQHSKSPSGTDRWLVSFSDRFLNERGEEVPFVWQATALEERSLKPLEERIAQYLVPIPPSLDGARVQVRVRLLFRSFPPHALRDLGLGDLVSELPTWEMDSFQSSFVPVLKDPPRRTEYRIPEDFASIQEAIGRLEDGDRLLVAAGEYLLSKPLSLEKAIEVRSISGPDATILRFVGDPKEKEASVVLFRKGNSAFSKKGRAFPGEARLEGFTITGGKGTEVNGSRKGGGIYIDHSSPTIARNKIADNQAEGGAGGGICCDGGNALILGSEIVSCRAEHGGAVALFSMDHALMKWNSIQGNVASDGGGLYLSGGTSLRIERSVIAGNEAGGQGGGLYVSQGTELEVDHSTLVFNHSGTGSGVLCEVKEPLPRFSNSILWGNEPGGSAGLFSYCILEEKSENATNISAFPLFVDPTGFWEKPSALAGVSLTQNGGSRSVEGGAERWVEGNYHVLLGSPAIDAGDPKAPPDLDDSRSDIGAFFFEQPLKAFVRGDVDGDGWVRWSDLRLLGEHLASEKRLPCLDAADLDDNGRVEPEDMISLAVFLLSREPAPPPPTGSCGLDPTFGEGLSCEEKGKTCKGNERRQ